MPSTDLDGQFKEFSEMEVTVRTGPDNFVLTQNYPNPFNPSTTISYQVPVQAFVTLKVYNALAQEVATLVSEKQTAGPYRVRLDASHLASGVYFYRILVRPLDSPQGVRFTAGNKTPLLK